MADEQPTKKKVETWPTIVAFVLFGGGLIASILLNYAFAMQIIKDHNVVSEGAFAGNFLLTNVFLLVCGFGCAAFWIKAQWSLLKLEKKGIIPYPQHPEVQDEQDLEHLRDAIEKCVRTGQEIPVGVLDPETGDPWATVCITPPRNGDQDDGS